MTNIVDANEGVIVAVMLVAMAAMFVAALAVPSAFGSAAFVEGGLRPVLWLAGLAIGMFGPLLGGMLAYVALRLRVARTLSRGR